MFSITYLEEKILTRTTFQLAVEKQTDCKIIYSSGDTCDFVQFLAAQQHPPDLCIIADCFHYTQLVKLIKQIKINSKHSCILLKSDAKFMKGICFLLKNGLNGFFFTDEPLIDLKQSVRSKTKYNLSADWLKLITNNRHGEIQIRELNYNQSPLTQNEITFIQACAKDISYEEIAMELKKSLATIYGYRDRIFKKLQVKQRTAMVMTALKRNYIDL